MKYTPPKPVMAKVQKMFEKQLPTSTIKDYLRAATGFKKTKINELYNELASAFRVEGAEEVTDVSVSETTPIEFKGNLEFAPRYTYNESSDQYIVYLKTLAKNVVIPGAKHRAMLAAYSNWNGDSASITQICRNFSFPKTAFIEYKSVFGWTHDHEPVSTEALMNGNVDDLVSDIIQDKRLKLHQEFQKTDWRMTETDAQKWRMFKAKQLDPFAACLKEWNPPECKPLPESVFKDRPANEDVFVVGIFDWHVAGFADARDLFRGKGWNTEAANLAIEKFVAGIATTVADRKQNFKKAVLLMGGDLFHGMRGHTEKGTPLQTDRLKDAQFDAIFDALTMFITNMSRLFENIEIQVVRGNHDGFDMYPLAKAVEAYFRNESRLKFDVHSTRTAIFRVESVLMLLDHGASDMYKAKIPKAGKPQESYIQSLLLAHPEMLVGVKQKAFVCGDMHHYEQREYNDFEYIMFGALPLGDRYADHSNFHSRARQNCLVIGKDGIKEVLHYYFD